MNDKPKPPRVLCVRCVTCKQIIAAQAVTGEPQPLGQFLLDYATHDLTLLKAGATVTIGGGCTCLPQPIPTAATPKN